MTLRFPYAVRDFEKIIRDGHIYLDRTHYIPVMENWGYELLLMRPRRFGKSLWLSTLMNYYDVAKADEFEQLFGALAVGQEPTPLHNSYLVMRWDFSRVSPQGSIEQIQESLNNHVNSRIHIFQQDYGEQLVFPFRIDPDDALTSFDALVNVVRQSGQKLYLFVDEYDNFANEIMMASSQGRRSGMQQRYLDLVKGEGIFKTFFKNLKSAGSGDGLERIFMTGVSPIVLNDVTSGANVFQNITWEPEFNELCGFTAAEIRGLAQEVVEACQLPAHHVEQIVSLMYNYYNGSRFIDEYEDAQEGTKEVPKVYNPTLALYFFDHFQRKCRYPKQIIDENLVPDDSKLAYIAGFEQGKALLENVLSAEKTVSVQTLRRNFGVRDLFDHTLQQDGLAVLLCYLGGLTSSGDLPDGGNTLEIPNLVMRKLYAERILAQMTQHDNAKIDAAHLHTRQPASSLSRAR
ncbi:MAG: AAA family ATPase [Chloroflexota bacterium]